MFSPKLDMLCKQSRVVLMLNCKVHCKQPSELYQEKSIVIGIFYIPGFYPSKAESFLVLGNSRDFVVISEKG